MVINLLILISALFFLLVTKITSFGKQSKRKDVIALNVLVFTIGAIRVEVLV
jgi:hypothetical protein